MIWEGYLTIFIVLGTVIGLSLEIASADALLFAGLALLILAGILTPQEALTGFSNQGMITVAILFVIAHAIQETGALDGFTRSFLKKQPRHSVSFLMLKMMIPVSCLSAFIYNTPLVVLFVPTIKKWAEKANLSASKFLIPLSYAAILGGMCTLIGTSTNLVIHGLMLENGMPGLSMFELAQVGIPCALVGWIYLAFFGKKLLPDHKDILEVVTDKRKEYVVEMEVKKGCELIHKTVTEAGLRNLKGLYLVDIERGGNSLGPVSSHQYIQEGDHLIFAGITSAVVELPDIHGLVPVTEETIAEDFRHLQGDFVEAVISSNAPVLGKTIKECGFRTKYGAAVIAVHRNGQRVLSKIGSIQLKPGDTLLLLANKDFSDRWKNSEDFYLISNVKTMSPRLYHKSYLTLGIIVLMILAAAFGRRFLVIGREPITLLHAALGAAVLLAVTGCFKVREARKSMRWDILVVIACSLGMSNALQKTGVAGTLASGVIQAAQGVGALGVLAVIYLLTVFVTEIMSNIAAAAVVFPIAVSAAAQMNASPKPFIIAITIAASASFITPIGYQTNLIVQGAGGYRYQDFVKIGVPLSILIFAIAITLIPLVWPF